MYAIPNSLYQELLFKVLLAVIGQGKIKQIVLLTMLTSMCSGLAFAQNATIDGIITEFESSASLTGANVVLANFDDRADVSGSSTDLNGLYSIRSIEPGTYIFSVSFLGFVTYTDTLTFTSGEHKTISVSLKADKLNLEEVIVEQTSGAASIERGRLRITPMSVSKVPAPVAGGDLVSYLQVLPGVVSLGNRGGQIFVRGGIPSENMILVDGALVYKPFHIMSYFSPFPDNLVSSADFYAGGFNAQYNGRISSVLDIKMRPGNLQEYSASASISPFLLDFSAEGPIEKGKLSWIASSKTSLIEETSPYFLNEEQPLKFGSQFIKITQVEEESRCSGMFLRTYDRGKVNLEKDESIKWKNIVAAGRCDGLKDGNFFDVGLNVSHLGNSYDSEGRSYYSNITQVRSDATVVRYADKFQYSIGAYWQAEFINFDLVGKVNGITAEELTVISTGGFAQLTIPLLKNLQFEPGVVLAINSDAPKSIEPRLRLTWEPIGENGELSMAYGVYRQAVVGLSDMRDATGVFVTWMVSPFEDKQSTAIHTLLGWQHDLGNGFNYSIEGFHKKLSSIPVSTWSTIASFSTNLSLSDGTVYGADTRIEYNKRWFYGFIGYGYTNTLYEAAQDNFGVWFDDPVVSYNPSHDRRHQINALGSIKKGSYTFGARWQFGSGVPFTKPIGFDEVFFFNEGLPDVENRTGTSRIIIDRPFEGRLPTYHSLDVSIERVFEMKGSDSKVSAKIGGLNLYNRANLFYYDVFTHRRFDQLPLTFYASLKVDIK